MLSDIADDGRLDGLRHAERIFDELRAEWYDADDDTPSTTSFSAEFHTRIDRAARRIQNS